MKSLTCHKEKISIKIKAVKRKVSLNPAWMLLPEGPDQRSIFWFFSKNGAEKCWSTILKPKNFSICSQKESQRISGGITSCLWFSVIYSSTYLLHISGPTFVHIPHLTKHWPGPMHHSLEKKADLRGTALPDVTQCGSSLSPSPVYFSQWSFLGVWRSFLQVWIGRTWLGMWELCVRVEQSS